MRRVDWTDQLPVLPTQTDDSSFSSSSCRREITRTSRHCGARRVMVRPSRSTAGCTRANCGCCFWVITLLVFASTSTHIRSYRKPVEHSGHASTRIPTRHDGGYDDPSADEGHDSTSATTCMLHTSTAFDRVYKYCGDGNRLGQWVARTTILLSCTLMSLGPCMQSSN